MTGSDASSAWPDLAGRIEGRRHILPVRVYFEDTDFSGLVYHGSYVRWCERGRSDWLRLMGISHRELIEADGGSERAAFVVRRLTLDYLKPARIDDVLEVVTECTSVTAATLELRQVIRRDGAELCVAQVLVVLVAQSGKPLRMPLRLRRAFAT